MASDFSWDTPAEEYLKIYQSELQNMNLSQKSM
jgi:glycogen synthase